jgi:hypothetical protein
VADDDVKTEELAPLAPPGWSLPEMTTEEMSQISQHFRSHKAGIPKFTPLICRGPDCEYAEECILIQQGVQPPLQRQCFVETNLIRTWMQGMADQLELEESDFFDVASIGAIAINQIIMKRALGVLAREPLVVESFRAMTPEGDPVFENKANPAIAILREFTKLNQEIYRDLMVTRREQSKDAARKIISPTEAAQKLRDRMKQVEVGLAQGKKSLIDHRQSLKTGEVIDAEFSVEGEEHGGLDQHQHRGEDGGIQGQEEGAQEGQAHGEGQGGEGGAVRGEASGAVREEEGGTQEGSPQEGKPQRQMRMRRDPVTGFMMPYYGEEEDPPSKGPGNNGSTA